MLSLHLKTPQVQYRDASIRAPLLEHAVSSYRDEARSGSRRRHPTVGGLRRRHFADVLHSDRLTDISIN